MPGWTIFRPCLFLKNSCRSLKMILIFWMPMSSMRKGIERLEKPGRSPLSVFTRKFSGSKNTWQMVNTKEDAPHMCRPHLITSWGFPASLQRYSRSSEQAYIPSVLGHCFHLSAIETPAVVKSSPKARLGTSTIWLLPCKSVNVFITASYIIPTIVYQPVTRQPVFFKK